MKRSTLVPAFLVSLLLTSVGQAAAADAKSNERSAAWPLALGSLNDVPARYPSRDGSAGAARLKMLASQCGVDFDAPRHGPPAPLVRQMSTFVDAQVVRADDRVDAPPRELADFFSSHQRQLDEIREVLLTSPIEWPLHADRAAQAPLPNLRAHLALTRMIAARALARRSWDDLHAAAMLQRGLTSRPELISQLVALSSMRIIVAAARKLPPPAPQWIGELTRFDVRRATLAAIQWEAWASQQESENGPSDPGSVRDRLADVVLKPFDELLVGNYVALLRRASFDLASSRTCAFDGRAFDRRAELRMPFWNVVARQAMPDLGRVWQRVARFEAEAEATENVLALKAGRQPTLKSNCSDGRWRLTQLPSGAKQLQFSRDIPLRRPQLPIPLQYTVQ